MTALDRVTAALDGVAHETVETADGCPCIRIEREQLHEVVSLLRDRCEFETNTFVTAVDNLPAEPRFEMTYQFLSVSNSDRIRVKTTVCEKECEVASITDLYPGAAYSEREVFDFFGIQFSDHADLKRLYMPEGYDHFPLRKDFPHRGIEPDKLYREWERRHAGGKTYRS